MIYAIIILSIITVFLLFLIIMKRQEFDILAQIEDNDLELNAKKLALSLRMPNAVGGSPRTNRILSRLRRSYSLISKKVRNNEEIYEFERWLYENYYKIISRFNNRAYREFAMLPHNNKKVRIISISEFILQSSYGKISKDKIKKVIEIFNCYTPLHNEEIVSLKDALTYVCIKNISDIAYKSLKYNKMKKLAERHSYVHERFSANDSYLYWFEKQDKTINIKDVNAKADINLDNIQYSFSSTLIDNSLMIGNFVKSLDTLTDIFNMTYTLELSYANSVMMCDEVYVNMDNTSKFQYLKAVEKLSNLFNVSEKNLIDACFALAKEHNTHFGYFLYENKTILKAYLITNKAKNLKIKNGYTIERLFSSVVFIAIALFSIGLSLFAYRNIYLFVTFLALLPFALFPTIEFLVIKAHKGILTSRPIPRLNNKTVPDNQKTMVVMPLYIGSENDLKSAITNILSLREDNKGDNIEFAMLIDYKKGDNMTLPTDIEWNRIIENELSAYSDVNAFIRKRKKIGNKYIGYERKRGALLALCECLITGDISAFSYIKNREIVKPEYIITLDADNKLLPNTVLNAINTISHPLNSEYDLLTFKNSYNLYSMNTWYSKQFYFESGYERYNEMSNYYYDMSKHSVYCGKGIFRLDNYFNKLKNILPDGKVLSHDIIEGAILNTGAMKETVFEDAPTSIISDTNRRNRWLRGDIQLGGFIRNKIKNTTGKINKINKRPIYNYIMFGNIIKGVSDIALLCLLLIPMFTLNPYHLVPFAVTLGAVLLVNFFSVMNGVTHGVQIRYVARGLLYLALQLFFRIIMLPFHAVNCLLTLINTLYRLTIRRDKLLEWKPFAAAQGENGIATYFRMMLPSFIVMLGVAVAGFNNWIVIGYVALYFAFALAMFSTGRNVEHNVVFTENESNFLHSQARKTYKYFDDMRDASGLVCDNYQVSPYKGKSINTSPTNIGFSLLSEISAYELGIIDKKTSEDKINAILESINSLKKYKGHLYNWYDIRTKQILSPNYISTVDSGNLLASLITVKQFLSDNRMNGVSICDKLISNMDFDFLLDRNKNLYYIGYNVTAKTYDGHYDLLASEAMLTYFILAVRNQDMLPWLTLKRDISSLQGGTLMSWSGTMFEYLMPSIFLRYPKNSLLEDTNKNVINISAKNKCKNIWGISESCYYKFDDRLNYQYYAFGLDRLAMKTGENRCVVSPYSTFLSLPIAPSKSLKNMEIIKKEDGAGEYGFYEAIDFTHGKNIIYSYMAHHQGMIITSIANALKSNIISDYFMKGMKTGELLLTERRLLSKAYRKPKSDFVYDKYTPKEKFVRQIITSDSPKVNLMTNGKYSVAIDDLARGFSYFDDIYVNKFRYDATDINNGYIASVKDLELGTEHKYVRKSTDDKAEYSVIYSPYESVYKNESIGMKMSVFIPHCLKGEVREHSIVNNGSERKKYHISGHLDLSLARFDDEIAHPVFSDMFIQTVLSKEKNSIIAHRKSRERNGDKYCCMTVNGLENVTFESNRYNCIGREGIDKNIKETSFGDVLYPCFHYECDADINGGSTLNYSVTIFVADTLEEIMAVIDTVNSGKYLDYAKESANIQSINIYKNLLPDSDFYDKSIELFSKIMYYPYEENILKNIAELNMISEYNKLGINGLFKTLKYVYKGNLNDAVNYCNIIRYINTCGVKCNLIIVYHESDIYHKNVENKIKKALGILPDYIKLTEETVLTDEINGTLFGNINDLQVTMQFNDKWNYNSKINYKKIDKPALNILSGSGGFTNNGYIITEPTLLPYSNVICDINGGLLITENGGGYFYNGNSREDKITIWRNDPIIDNPSEWLFLTKDSSVLRLNKLSPEGYVEYSHGKAKFVGATDGIEWTSEQYIICSGNIKITELTIKNLNDYYAEYEIIYGLNPGLYFRETPVYCHSSFSSDILTYTNYLTEKSCYVKCVNLNNLCDTDIGDRYAGFSAKGIKGSINIVGDGTEKIIIAVSTNIEALKDISITEVSEQKLLTLNYFGNLNKIKIETDNKALDILFNECLMYQVVSARLNGRCGYYQCGGAIGFRDQLQDCLAFLYSDTEYVRRHIIDSAEHQFIEGDVMHWWHPPFLGVRTQISDDKLFLPYLVSEYIKVTGDISILEENCPYITGNKLKKGEESRYGNATQTNIIGTIKEHCIKAIENALKYGENDLLLIGSGDWNDALNGIGMDGKGVSVWLTMFAYFVIEKFMEYMNETERLHYLKVLDKLYSAVNKAYNGSWFKRAMTDSGEWLGDSSSEVCKIDLICQSFAVLSGIATKAQAVSSLKSAEKLVDYDKGIVKLLDPPFNKKNYYGYISSYPEGVRENGGQYTHAVAWYIKAIAKYDRNKAMNILNTINPILKNINMKETYKGEPYVMSGDVYSNGRAGWTWYTGSASWIYKVILEDIIGVSIESNNLCFNPDYIEELGNIKLNMNWKEAKYEIEIIKTGRKNVSLNGINYNSNYRIPLFNNNKTYNIIVEY